MFKSRFSRDIGCENEFARDRNHGLYSLASRLDVPFKNVYPDSLRFDIFRSCEFARHVKSGKAKMMCKCTYLTHNLFALRNKKTKREAYACYPCIKDLIDSQARCEAHRYTILRRHRKWDGQSLACGNTPNANHRPMDDIYDYLTNKQKNMIECAHYFKVISDDDRAILFDDQCDSRDKRALKKTVELFFIIGNGYNYNDLGRSLILNDEKNDDIVNQETNNVEC